MTNPEESRVKRLLAYAATLAALALVGWLLNLLPSCGGPPRKIVVDVPSPTTVTVIETGTDTSTDTGITCDGGLDPGQTVDEPCEDGLEGRTVYVCQGDGSLRELITTCNDVPPPPPPACDATKTSFAAVQPILNRNCGAPCHTGKDEFEKAKTDMADWIARVNSPRGAAGHMPKDGELTGAEKAVLQKWVDDGYCPAPDDGGDDNAFIDRDQLEEWQVKDVVSPRVPADQRTNTRYITFAHIIDVGAVDATIKAFANAAHKGVNSVSVESQTKRLVEVAPGLLRLNLDDYGLTPEDWIKIEDADVIDLESETSRGELLKTLTGTRKPAMQVDLFTDAVFRTSALYHDLANVPEDFITLTEQIAVDFAADLVTQVEEQPFNLPEAKLGAFVGSPLSPHNRMVSRHRARGVRNGSLYCTYDTGALDVPEKNFFERPELGDTGGNLSAFFIAGECIWVLPNGLHAYGLFNARQTFRDEEVLDANGRVVRDGFGRPVTQRVFVRSDLDRRQDVAPVDVVRDYLNPVSAEIRNSVSCFRCHSGGFLRFRDQIRDHVSANGSEFGEDRDIILASYPTNAVWEQTITADNAAYCDSLGSIGINCADADPITVAQDYLLTEWNLDKVAARFHIRPADFRLLLNGSATARVQVGQLLSGGTITFDQFKASVQVLKEELRLLQERVE